MNRSMLYNTIYAFAALDGRANALFGKSAPFAYEAFERSVAGDYFPELWFELPLLGTPKFDLHALVTHGDLKAGANFSPESCGEAPEAFAWFASQTDGVRQLALSWDTGSGVLTRPAVQLLTGHGDPSVVCGFLDAVGRHDATDAYRTFEGRLPEGWVACYAGVFPQRTTPFLRVECIPESSLQELYSLDGHLLETHLRQLGFTAFDDTLLPACQQLANTPFKLEFQFDVESDGTAGVTFSASVRFNAPTSSGAWKPFEADGAGGDLMRQVQERGLADERWQLLSGTTFGKRATLGNESVLLWCYPAFLKLRWRDGAPLDAKAYLMAGVQ